MQSTSIKLIYYLRKLFFGFAILYISNVLASDGVITKEPLLIEIIIQNHRFIPNEINVPSGKKIKLVVRNEDDVVEEFESFDLKREKIIAPGSYINVILAPLKPGRYKFFGDFHHDTAQGVLNVE